MNRLEPVRTRPGQKPGELVVTLPPGWDLRLRRVLKELMVDSLPDPREKGLTPAQQQGRVRRRQRQMRDALCRFVSDLITADIIGKEVALSTRSRYGNRTGSLREHVAAILRETGS